MQFITLVLYERETNTSKNCLPLIFKQKKMSLRLLHIRIFDRGGLSVIAGITPTCQSYLGKFGDTTVGKTTFFFITVGVSSFSFVKNFRWSRDCWFSRGALKFTYFLPIQMIWILQMIIEIL